MKKSASIGLFAWFPYEKNNRIMVIHNDMGSTYATDGIFKYMEYKGYDISYVSLSCIISGDAADRHYDYILAVDCLEYVDNEERFWETLSCLLEENGKVVICCENRLGLKTFCGQDLFCVDLPREKVCGRYIRNLSEIKAGIESAKSVLTDIFVPLPNIEKSQIILKYGYRPNENIIDRIDTSDAYSFNAVANRYSVMRELMDNDSFYPMADWYILVVSKDGGESLNINQVSVSADRDEEKSFVTLVSCDRVIKRALYDSGRDRLKLIKDNLDYLMFRNLKTVKAESVDDSLVMPYINCKTAAETLRGLLRTDTEKFVHMMDRYRDLVFASSEVSNRPPVFSQDEHRDIIRLNETYKCNLDFSDLGRVLKKGLLDLVPVNLFCDGEEYVAYDQEYLEEDYPANAILYRGICCIFGGKDEWHRMYDFDKLLERYDLKKNQAMWVWYAERFLHGINAEISDKRDSYLQTAFEKRRKVLLDIMSYPCLDRENCLLDMEELTSRVIVWGTGKFAEAFFEKLPPNVEIIKAIDSDINKNHTVWHGIEVLSFEETISCLEDCEIIVCAKNYRDIVEQLINNNVFNFKIYDPDCCLKERAK